VQTGRLAIQHGADILLLDDGMQHRRLHRDKEIVVMRADDLFGGSRFLPRGFLRDAPQRLSCADHILITGPSDPTIAEKLRPYTSAPITGMGITTHNSHEFSSKKVAAFCAIADPKKFYDTLKTHGCEILETLEKPDHRPFTQEELQSLANRAKGASLLVCTEKDAVKLPKNLHLPIIPVKISLNPTWGDPIMLEVK
jgi:tetraacyldisaccharide 4'-kinase